MRPPRLIACVSIAVLAAAATAGVEARTPKPAVVYDSEYGGYVPIVDGIERPDLVTRGDGGAVPRAARDAERLARRALRRRGGDPPPASVAKTFGLDATDGASISRRWLRRRAVVTDLVILDHAGAPLSGAFVYRYYDPSFYAVNEDTQGRRLFNTYRYLPYPVPAEEAISAVVAHHEWWRGMYFAPVRAADPDIDAMRNPFRRDDRVLPVPPVEFVGRTGDSGSLRVISGLFNVRDPKKFPRAIVPAAMKVGFVVVAEGHEPAFSERRLREGGVAERRTIRLIRAADGAFVEQLDVRTASRRLSALDLSAERAPSEVDADVERLLARLRDQAFRLPPESRQALLAEHEARFLVRLARLAAPAHRERLLRRAVEATPEVASRLYELALELSVREGLRPYDEPPPVALDPTEPLVEAERLARRATEVEPGFLPSYMLLDRLVARRHDLDARAANLRRLLRVAPFDPWGRARMAVVELARGRTARAFDHLRFTWAAVPGMGGDLELARALADHYWRRGLPEKAGTLAWLATGRPPEDPFERFLRRR